MLRPAIIVAALIGSYPAFAQDRVPAVDLMAVIAAGLSEGGQITVGPVGNVTRTAAGMFEVRGPDGTGPDIMVEETAPCVFLLTFAFPGRDPMSMQFDSNLIASYAFTSGGMTSGLNGFEISLEGEDGMLLAQTPDGPKAPPDSKANLVTSLEQADLEAAVTALREDYCPGLTP